MIHFDELPVQQLKQTEMKRERKKIGEACYDVIIVRESFAMNIYAPGEEEHNGNQNLFSRQIPSIDSHFSHFYKCYPLFCLQF